MLDLTIECRLKMLLERQEFQKHGYVTAKCLTECIPLEN